MRERREDQPKIHWGRQGFAAGCYRRPSQTAKPHMLRLAEQSNGDRAIRIDRFQVEIYGTTAKMRRSIGAPASFGCIRMLNENVVGLIDRLSIGTSFLRFHDNGQGLQKCSRAHCLKTQILGYRLLEQSAGLVLAFFLRVGPMTS